MTAMAPLSKDDLISRLLCWEPKHLLQKKLLYDSDLQAFWLVRVASLS